MIILATNKFKIIKTLVFQALIDIEISQENFNAIIREKKKIYKDERKCEKYQ